jgi:hypothetical protein
MRSEENKRALVIGGEGEFGQFLQRNILPILGVDDVLTSERETSRDESLAQLQRARHIVLATPLAGYAELALPRSSQPYDALAHSFGAGRSLAGGHGYARDRG